MNPDLVNLLGALRARPEDEVAFLALADWCLEQPDDATVARGEHVRLSLRLCHLPRTDPTARDLRRRVKAIEKRWRVAWLGPLRELGHRCDFLPGGLVKLEMTRRRSLRARKAKPLTAEQFAWVSSLEVRSALLDDLRWLAGRLPAGQVRSFRVQLTSADGLVRVLSRCRWLRGLRSLSLCSHAARIAEAELVQLAGLRRLGDLGELKLYNASLDVPGGSALGSSPYLSHLRELSLSYSGLPTPALQALLSPSFTPPASDSVPGEQ